MAGQGLLSFDKAMRQIRRLVNQGGTVLGHHAEDRMVERGIDTADIIHILTYGKVTHVTRKQNNWR